MFKATDLKVYFICGTQDVKSNRTIHDVLQEALEAGITLFQFREKGPTSLQGEEKRHLAEDLLALCHQYDVPFIVNDDIELAKAIDADGVHVGQDDVAVAEFASEFEDKIIGLSVGNVDEYHHSDLTYIDYIGVGPMYATQSKDDANAPVGPEMIPTLREYVGDLPIVAIGGITTSNAQDCFKAGADGVSVISAIAQSDDIKGTVAHFLQSAKESQ
ncbi:thiamine phosphate synthase [Staphylococcus argensis]|uniref:Thiamine-phosphate synthase n=1 Tax=Staphylococcus argensis TaxID=1607738 RepID=A0A2K4FCS5_9STAP|nr:thiamine phosphate synthase [Staphylococcus argensis]MCY6992345.1 thiamine phosphate synthase [Staphylococcus argensis]POA09066.1 thiamine phosphate synthase [Staphylococcus argensis]